jgi:hypothetical protein
VQCCTMLAICTALSLLPAFLGSSVMCPAAKLTIRGASCCCRVVLVQEARRCIYGHELEGYKQVGHHCHARTAKRSHRQVVGCDMRAACLLHGGAQWHVSHTLKHTGLGGRRWLWIVAEEAHCTRHVPCKLFPRAVQATEDGGLELVGGSKEERQGLTADDGMDTNGASNGHRFDLADDEDDEDLAFATAKFAKD